MKRFRSYVEIKLLVGIPALLAALAIFMAPALGENLPHTSVNAGGASGTTQAKPPDAPRCVTVDQKEVTVTCDYKATSRTASQSEAMPRIVLNRMSLSFKTNDDSHMRIELTFTNDGSVRIEDARTIYLAINDDKGKNHMQRPLPQVDFRKLLPGQTLTFSDVLLAPAFSPGHYTIHLWIPSSVPSQKFDAAHNFLLSSAGVANPVTGLNVVAEFTAAVKPRH